MRALLDEPHEAAALVGLERGVHLGERAREPLAQGGDHALLTAERRFEPRRVEDVGGEDGAEVGAQLVGLVTQLAALAAHLVDGLEDDLLLTLGGAELGEEPPREPAGPAAVVAEAAEAAEPATCAASEAPEPGGSPRCDERHDRDDTEDEAEHWKTPS